MVLKADAKQPEHGKWARDPYLDDEYTITAGVCDDGRACRNVVRQSARQRILDARRRVHGRSVGDRRCAFDHDVCVGRVSGAFLRAGGQRVTGVEGKTQLEDRQEQRDENQRHQHEIDNS
jgi:hypothetical protein